MQIISKEKYSPEEDYSNIGDFMFEENKDGQLDEAKQHLLTGKKHTGEIIEGMFYLTYADLGKLYIAFDSTEEGDAFAHRLIEHHRLITGVSRIYPNVFAEKDKYTPEDIISKKLFLGFKFNNSSKNDSKEYNENLLFYIENVGGVKTVSPKIKGMFFVESRDKEFFEYIKFDTFEEGVALSNGVSKIKKDDNPWYLGQ